MVFSVPINGYGSGGGGGTVDLSDPTNITILDGTFATDTQLSNAVSGLCSISYANSTFVPVSSINATVCPLNGSGKIPSGKLSISTSNLSDVVIGTKHDLV